ncbi:MAG: hypothetical protein Q8807_03035 ['Waltheria sp.' little leaf phytoplasma]|nr:hypothetical protein ['Waltheria sp.' little leaf phytoplasma]
MIVVDFQDKKNEAAAAAADAAAKFDNMASGARIRHEQKTWPLLMLLRNLQHDLDADASTNAHASHVMLLSLLSLHIHHTLSRTTTTWLRSLNQFPTTCA